MVILSAECPSNSRTTLRSQPRMTREEAKWCRMSCQRQFVIFASFKTARQAASTLLKRPPSCDLKRSPSPHVCARQSLRTPSAVALAGMVSRLSILGGLAPNREQGSVETDVAPFQ